MKVWVPGTNMAMECTGVCRAEGAGGAQKWLLSGVSSKVFLHVTPTESTVGAPPTNKRLHSSLDWVAGESCIFICYMDHRGLVVRKPHSACWECPAPSHSRHHCRCQATTRLQGNHHISTAILQPNCPLQHPQVTHISTITFCGFFSDEVWWSNSLLQ